MFKPDIFALRQVNEQAVRVFSGPLLVLNCTLWACRDVIFAVKDLVCRPDHDRAITQQKNTNNTNT